MTYALEVSSLSKSFSNRLVLNAVDLTVRPGEVVGLVGQNGCGKSTLIKILSGVYEPDEGGRLKVAGEVVELPGPAGSSTTLGLVFVHQDLGLFLDGSILENMRVGRYETGFAWHIRWKQERAACRESLRRIGLEVSPDLKVGELSQVDRALVAIARAVDQARDMPGGGVMVLDEPTSYLPRDGADRLFDAVRELRAAGMGVILVSHKIDEVLSISDTITVLREGEVVARLRTADTDEDGVVKAMLGRTLDHYYPARRTEALGEVVFDAVGVTGEGIDDVDLAVRRGEILGVTGILGMGQERLLYLLNGSNPGTGSVSVSGTPRSLRTMTPSLARDLGIALLPADRVRTSGVQEATLMENITLVTLSKYVTLGRIRHQDELAATKELTARYDVRPPEPARQMRTFSGGNQQKALLAKWLNSSPQILLLHEPTQGVDVGSKQQIFQQLRDVADLGLSIIIATTEYEDLAMLCDRVAVMRDGRKAVELEGPELTHERLVEECYRNARPAA